jgi:hypothetical protein
LGRGNADLIEAGLNEGAGDLRGWVMGIVRFAHRWIGWFDAVE